MKLRGGGRDRWSVFGGGVDRVTGRTLDGLGFPPSDPDRPPRGTPVLTTSSAPVGARSVLTRNFRTPAVRVLSPWAEGPALANRSGPASKRRRSPQRLQSHAHGRTTTARTTGPGRPRTRSQHEVVDVSHGPAILSVPHDPSARSSRRVVTRTSKRWAQARLPGLHSASEQPPWRSTVAADGRVQHRQVA
jgi:hypothetical protein